MGGFKIIKTGAFIFIPVPLCLTFLDLNNELYRQEGMKEPLIVWWIFVPGLNLIVGLWQIHFLSQFWAMKQGIEVKDNLAESLPFLSANA